mgnify:FL=1
MFKKVLSQLMNKEILTRKTSYEAMRIILQGKATPSQMSSFITLLSFRGIETEELIGLTEAMRDHALMVPVDDLAPVVDTCGTGGDGTNTFNISTASAIVASSAGLNIAKHGNRSVSSLSGSADVLEELGLPVKISAEGIREALRTDHMCFMFAPLYHQAMKHVAPTRKEIGFRTVFNLLGPLTNPAGAKNQVIGVYDDAYSLKIAETLKELGSRHVLIVKGEDGLDELSISGPTRVTELKAGTIRQYLLTPEEVGLKRYPLTHIQVQNASQSAAIIRDVFAGNNRSAAYNIVAFNAGAALYVGGKAKNMAEGVQLAKALLDSGKVQQHYQRMISRKGALKHA